MQKMSGDASTSNMRNSSRSMSKKAVTITRIGTVWNAAAKRSINTSHPSNSSPTTKRAMAIIVETMSEPSAVAKQYIDAFARAGQDACKKVSVVSGLPK